MTIPSILLQRNLSIPVIIVEELADTAKIFCHDVSITGWSGTSLSNRLYLQALHAHDLFRCMSAVIYFQLQLDQLKGTTIGSWTSDQRVIGASCEQIQEIP